MNIYYDPQKFGLTPVGTVELGGGYEFDTYALWRNIEGALVWAHDSGCSCPTPFEDLGVDDLLTGTAADFQSWVEESIAAEGWHEGDAHKGQLVDLLIRVGSV